MNRLLERTVQNSFLGTVPRLMDNFTDLDYAGDDTGGRK